MRNKVMLWDYYEKLDNPNSKECVFNKNLSFEKYFYILTILVYFKNNHDLLYNLLIKCSDNQTKAALSLFVGNYFFFDFFSQKLLNDKYLLLVSRTIDDEIKSISNISNCQLFLNSSINSYLFKQFLQTYEVQKYFKVIVKPIIKIISEKKQSLSLKMSSLLSLVKEAQDKNIPIESLPNESELLNDYFIDFEIAYLTTMIEQETDPNMKDYILRQIEEGQASKKDSIFSTNSFLESIYSESSSQDVLHMYIINLVEITKLFDILFDNLLANIDLLPKTLKRLSKIILLLFKKNHPNLKQIEYNSFVSRLFFEILLTSILEKPIYEKRIENYKENMIIQNNIFFIHNILSTFISGYFFKETDNSHLTTLNMYFLKKMPFLLKFMQQLVDVDLPEDVDYYIKNGYTEELSKRVYQAGEESIRDESIVFNPNYTLILIEHIQKNYSFLKEYINNNINDILTSKLKTVRDILTNLRMTDQQKNIQTFYFISNVKYTKTFLDMFAMQIGALALPIGEENIAKKDFALIDKIKLKNVLFHILFSCINIQDDYREEYKNDTLPTLIMKLSRNKTYITGEGNKSNCAWNLFKKLIEEIEVQYKENDYEKLFKEILYDLINAMKSSEKKIEIINIIKNRIEISESRLKFYEDINFYLKTIQCKKVIEKFKDYQLIEINLAKNVKIVNNSILAEDKLKSEDIKIGLFDPIKHKKGKNTYNTINEFIKILPDYRNQYKDFQIDILSKETIMDDLLTQGFGIFKQELDKCDLFKSLIDQPQNEQQQINPYIITSQSIYNLLRENVMTTLYDKLYPLRQNKDDIDIHNKCKELSWITINNLAKDPLYYYELKDILPLGIKYIHKMEEAKTPELKYKEIVKLIELIDVFEGQDASLCQKKIDNHLPVSIYLIIKAQPKRLASNLRYIEEYLDETDKTSKLQKMTLVTGTMMFIQNITYDQLFNISEDEFKK